MISDESKVHQKLVAECEAEGIRLIFDICLSSEDPGDSADSYRPALYGEAPSISVWRTDPELPDDQTNETTTLAHEYGHHLAHKAGLVSEAHQEARNKADEDYAVEYGSQTTNEIHLVLAEEELAWAFARSTLARLGFSSWDRFDRQRANALASYSFRIRSPLFDAAETRAVYEWLAEVESSLGALELNVLSRSEALAEIATLRAQLSSSAPKLGIITASSRALGHVIAEAYGANAAMLLIAAWPEVLSPTKPEPPRIGQQ